MLEIGRREGVSAAPERRALAAIEQLVADGSIAAADVVVLLTPAAH
jgi:hypothetical protein